MKRRKRAIAGFLAIVLLLMNIFPLGTDASFFGKLFGIEAEKSTAAGTFTVPVGSTVWSYDGNVYKVTGYIPSSTGDRVNVISEYGEQKWFDLKEIMVDMEACLSSTNISFSNHNYSGNRYKDATGNNISGLTGKSLYINDIMALNGAAAKALYDAETVAESQGYSLKVYDGYRPYSVTTTIHDLADSAGFSNAGLSHTASAMNRALGIDVSLVQSGSEVTGPIFYFGSSANSYTDTLKDILASAGFSQSGTSSLWWEFLYNGNTLVGNNDNCSFQLMNFEDKTSSVSPGLNLGDIDRLTFPGVAPYDPTVTVDSKSGTYHYDRNKTNDGQTMVIYPEGIEDKSTDHNYNISKHELQITGNGLTSKTTAFCADPGFGISEGATYSYKGDLDAVISEYGAGNAKCAFLATMAYASYSGDKCDGNENSKMVYSRPVNQAFVWIALGNDGFVDMDDVLSNPQGVSDIDVTYQGSTISLTNEEAYISKVIYDLLKPVCPNYTFDYIATYYHRQYTLGIPCMTPIFSDFANKLSAGTRPSAYEELFNVYHNFFSGQSTNVDIVTIRDLAINWGSKTDDEKKYDVYLWSCGNSSKQKMLTFSRGYEVYYVALEINKVDSDGNPLASDDYIFTATYKGVDYPFTRAGSVYTLDLSQELGTPIPSDEFPLEITVKETLSAEAAARPNPPVYDNSTHIYSLSPTSQGVARTQADALAEPYECTNVLGFTDGTFVNDTPVRGMNIILFKNDNESGGGIAQDAEFVIVDDNGNEYTYTDKKGNDHPITFSHTAATRYESSEILFDEEDEGKTFYVVEKTAPRFYFGDWTGSAGVAGSITGKNKYPFVLTDGSQIIINDGEPIINNEQKGKIVLSKKDIESDSHLADYGDGYSHMTGTLYGLFAKDNIEWPDGYRSGVAFNEGDLVAVSAIDEDGELVFDDLYHGDYYIQELYVNYGNDHKHMAFSLKDANGDICTGKIMYHDWNGDTRSLEKENIEPWRAFCECGIYTRTSGSGEYKLVDPNGSQYEHLEFTGYYADYVTHDVTISYTDESDDIVSEDVTSYEQIPKAKFSFFKATSSEISSIGYPLEGAGFKIYRIDQLSKYNDSWLNSDGKTYNIAAIRNSYLSGQSTGRHLDSNGNYVTVDIYDFSGEDAALATLYINDNNHASVTSFDDHSGKTYTEWLYEDAQQDIADGKLIPLGGNKYQVAELFSDSYGRVNTPYMPFGQYVIVETTTPEDYEQTLPFIMQLYSHGGSAKVSEGINEDSENGKTLANSDPDSRLVKDGTIYESWYSYSYLVEDKPVTMRLFLHKYDRDTEKEVFKDGAEYHIYKIDALMANGKVVKNDIQFTAYKNAHNRITFNTSTDTDGNEVVTWTDLDGTGYAINYELVKLGGVYYRAHLLENEVDVQAPNYTDIYTFKTQKLINREGYTTGCFLETQQLEVGNYYVKEMKAPNGFYNDPNYYITFKVTTGREYDIETKLNAEHSRDYTFAENYYDEETRGRIVLYKKGEVLSDATKTAVTDTALLNAIDASSADIYDFTYTEEYVPGAVYYIYADEDIITQDAQYVYDGSGNVQTTVDQYGYTVPLTTTWFKKGDLVAVVNTGYANQNTEEQNVVYDGSAAGCEVTYDPLTDTYSAVYHGESTGSYSNPNNSQYNAGDHPIVKVTANIEGKVVVDLPLGKYKIKESSAPFGMTVSDEEYSLEYTWKDDEHAFFYTDDVDTDTHVDLAYRAASSTEPTEYQTEGLVWTNDRIKATAEAVKIADDGSKKPLKNVTVGLYTYDDIYDYHGRKLVEASELSPALIGYATSDDNGKMTFVSDIPLGYYKEDGAGTYKVATQNSNILGSFELKTGYTAVSSYLHDGGYYTVYAGDIDSATTVPTETKLLDIIANHSYTDKDALLFDESDFTAITGNTLPTDVNDFETSYTLGDGYTALKHDAFIGMVDNDTTIDQYRYVLQKKPARAADSDSNYSNVDYDNLYFEMVTIVNQNALAIKDALYSKDKDSNFEYVLKKDGTEVKFDTDADTTITSTDSALDDIKTHIDNSSYSQDDVIKLTVSEAYSIFGDTEPTSSDHTDYRDSESLADGYTLDLTYDTFHMAAIDAEDVYSILCKEIPEDLQTLDDTIPVIDNYRLKLIAVDPGQHEETTCEYVVVKDNESDVIYTGQYPLDEVDGTLDETVLRARTILNEKVQNNGINVGDVFTLDATELLVDVLNTTVPTDASNIADRYHLGNGIYAVKLGASNTTTRDPDTINGYVLNYNGNPVVFDTDADTTITSTDSALDFIKTQISSGYNDGDVINVTVADAYANATALTAPTSTDYTDYEANIALADGYTLVLDYTEGATHSNGVNATFKLVNVNHKTANTGNYIARELSTKSNGIWLKNNDLALSFHVYHDADGKITKTFNGTEEKVFQKVGDKTDYLNITGTNYIANKATKVPFSKKTFGGVELAGATFVLRDNDDGSQADMWTSNGSVHNIYGLKLVENLPADKNGAGSYLLREIAAPSGFALASDKYVCLTGEVDAAATALKGETVFKEGIWKSYVWYDTYEDMEVSQIMATGIYTCTRTDANGYEVFENSAGDRILIDEDGYYHDYATAKFIYNDQDGNLLVEHDDGLLYYENGTQFIEDATHTYHKVNSGYTDYNIAVEESLEWTLNKDGQLLIVNKSANDEPFRFFNRLNPDGSVKANAPVMPWEEVPLYQTDENGAYVLDSNNQKIELNITIDTVALHDDTSILIPNGYFDNCTYIYDTQFIRSKVESVVTGGGWNEVSVVNVYDKDVAPSHDTPSPSYEKKEVPTPAAVPTKYPVKVSKTMVTGGPELPGASLEIIDDKGNSVEKWISTTEEHVVSLYPGTYTLRELWAQTGFSTGEDITFTVYPNNQVTHVQMVDEYTQVEITKKTITGEEELPGAVLTVTDKDNTIVDQWVSGSKPHYINGKLEGGETYTLTEVATPNGYGYASSIQFTVNKDNTVTLVPMKDVVSVKTDDPVDYHRIYCSILALLAVFICGGVYFIPKRKKIRLKSK